MGPLPPPRGGGYSPIKVTEVLVVPFRGLNLWIGIAWGEPEMTAARVVSVRFMTILSKSRKLSSLLLKFAVPVI